MKNLITNNPKLEVGDEVVLLHMDNEAMMPGLVGKVLSIGPDPFERGNYIIEVQWENGSSLSLLSGHDVWGKYQ